MTAERQPPGQGPSVSTPGDQPAPVRPAAATLRGRSAALLAMGLGLAVVPSLPFLQASSATFVRFQRWSIFAGGLLVGAVLTTVRAQMRERPVRGRGRPPDRGPRMPAAMGAIWISLAGTAITALALFADTLLAQPHEAALVRAHEISAAALALAMLAKMSLIGPRAAASRALRIWGSLVGHLALAVGAYATVTGVVVIIDPTWSNQHLAAGFWSLVLVGCHIVQARRFTRRIAR